MSKQIIICIILLGLILLFSFFGWLNLRQLLFSGYDGTEIFLVTVLFLMVMAVFSVLILLFDSWKILMAAVGIILSAYILVFGLHWAYLAVFTGGIGLLVAGIAQTRNEKGLRIKIMPLEATRPAASMLFTVFVAAIAVVIYFSPPARELTIKIKIPRPLFDLAFSVTERFLAVPLQAGPQSLINIPGLPQIELKEFIQSQRSNGIVQIFTPEVKDNIYGSVNSQLNDILERYKRYLPYGLAIAVFLTLRTFGFIFVWLAGLMTSIIFSLLRSLKIVGVGKEMVEREIIQI